MQHSGLVALQEPVPLLLLQVELRYSIYAPNTSCPASSLPELCSFMGRSVTPSGNDLLAEHSHLLELTNTNTLHLLLMESTMDRQNLINVYNA